MKLQQLNLWQNNSEDIHHELRLIDFPIDKLNSIEIELKENHLASASFIKVI